MHLRRARSALRARRASSRLSTSTCARDRSAPFSSKDGFSVVAPTSVMVPSSMTGRKLSCCERLKRWISSTKSSVPWPCSRRERAASKAFLRSATPEKIADICSKTRPVAPASKPRDGRLSGAGRPPEDDRRHAPGGNHAGQHAFRTGMWSWPTTSDSFCGRKRSASGRGASFPSRPPGRDWPSAGRQLPSCMRMTRPPRLTANCQ